MNACSTAKTKEVSQIANEPRGAYLGALGYGTDRCYRWFLVNEDLIPGVRRAAACKIGSPNVQRWLCYLGACPRGFGWTLAVGAPLEWYNDRRQN